MKTHKLHPLPTRIHEVLMRKAKEMFMGFYYFIIYAFLLCKFLYIFLFLSYYFGEVTYFLSVTLDSIFRFLFIFFG